MDKDGKFVHRLDDLLAVKKTSDARKVGRASPGVDTIYADEDEES